MIKDSDIDFHPTDSAAHDWAETNYFAFFGFWAISRRCSGPISAS